AAMSPCPRYWNESSVGMPQLAYNPAVMPAGENWIKLYAYDPLGHRSGEGGEPVSEVDIKGDHAKPKLAPLGGSITDQAALGPTRPSYALHYSATDGGEVAPSPNDPPSALSSFGSEGPGNGQFKHPGDIAVDPQGNLWVIDESNNRIEKFS